MRFTRKCRGNTECTYRLPVLDGQEMYSLEDNTVRLQENERVPNAYFGQAINSLGRYEDLGTVEEIAEKLAKLGKLDNEGVLKIG